MDRDQLVQAVFEIITAFRQRAIIAKAEHGEACPFTRQQQELIFYLQHHGRATISAIAGSMGTTPSAATQLVEGLVKQVVVERVADPDDRRVVHVQLTASGHEQLASLSKKHVQKLRQTVQPLTNQELEQLLGLLSKLVPQI